MNTMKSTLGAAVLVGMVSLLAGPGMAQVLGGVEPAGKVIQLTQTKHGEEVNAVGAAKISANQGVETFGVVVSADVADGKAYVVEVTTAKGVFKVADLEMFLGTGTVRQTNLTSATKAFPVANLRTVTVRDRGGVLLTGQFVALSPQS